MFDKYEDVAEKYDFTLQGTVKGRGALILDTNQGLKALKEYRGSGKHLIWSQDVLEKIDMDEGLLVDSCIRNKEGEFVSEAKDGSHYIIKNWYESRDCDVKHYEDIMAGARALGKLHNLLEKYAPTETLYVAKELSEDFVSHNREIKKVRKYLYSKNNRTEFESLATGYCDEYLNEGREAIKWLDKFKASKKMKKGFCHGSYNFHNIGFYKDVPVIINFEKMNYNYQMVDLYTFLRKIMEKTDWDMNIGHNIILKYSQERMVSNEDMELLAIMFSYPEKFWKLINGYFNSNKAWISGKKTEKLVKLVEQNKHRHEFIKSIYS